MTERDISPERQIVSIANNLKREGYKVGTERYNELVKIMRFDHLHEQTIAEALKNGNRQEVHEVISFLTTTEPFI